MVPGLQSREDCSGFLESASFHPLIAFGSTYLGFSRRTTVPGKSRVDDTGRELRDVIACLLGTACTGASVKDRLTKGNDGIQESSDAG